MQLKNPELLQTGVFIGNTWCLTANTYAVINPSTLEKVADVARCGSKECDAAIKNASEAFSTFKKTTASERAKYLRRMSELMVENQEDLATIMTTEQGKPLAESMVEVAYAASFFEWFSEESRRVYGDIIPSNKPGAKVLVTKEPVGVVVAITPWNFPLAMFTRKAGAAIAAGCTLVWKPSEETPLSANALAVLAKMAGLPNGVINIVSGDAVAIGGSLMESKLVKKITFTGSTKTGKLLMSQAANTVKKISMELGGNAPFIVFDDADIDLAVQGAMASKFRNAGQTCVCVNRFYIQDGVYDQFTTKLLAKIKQLKVGDGFTQDVNIGPLINQAAVDKVAKHVNDAKEYGGKVLCGGKPCALGGTFYEPTLIVDATHTMQIASEEVFGPVAACFRFKNDEEVIAMANDTDFGLASYCYTSDAKRMFAMSEALEYGMVGINDVLIFNETIPFGGVKQSGFGREGSKYGVDDYLNIKCTTIHV